MKRLGIIQSLKRSHVYVIVWKMKPMFYIYDVLMPCFTLFKFQTFFSISAFFTNETKLENSLFFNTVEIIKSRGHINLLSIQLFKRNITSSISCFPQFPFSFFGSFHFFIPLGVSLCVFQPFMFFLATFSYHNRQPVVIEWK